MTLIAIGLLTASCSSQPYFVAKDEPWRREGEIACLRSGAVRPSPFVNASRATLGGPGACGAVQPLEMSAALGGRVVLKPAALVQCAMVPAVDRWTAEVVMPAARRFYGMPVTALEVMASYSCRPRNNVHGGKLSEHGHANAIDIGAFTLADGRTVTVKSGWGGDPADRAFLRAVRAGACGYFTTVLGPGSDRNHADHFHLDLARHNRDGSRRHCG